MLLHYTSTLLTLLHRDTMVEKVSVANAQLARVLSIAYVADGDGDFLIHEDDVPVAPHLRLEREGPGLSVIPIKAFQ